MSLPATVSILVAVALVASYLLSFVVEALRRQSEKRRSNESITVLIMMTVHLRQVHLNIPVWP